MTATVFDECIHEIEQCFSKLPDKRVGTNQFIKMKDIGLSVFSVFFMQCPSFLDYQRVMQKKKGCNNANSLFKVDHIPSDNHCRAILDEVPPSKVFPLFNTFLNIVSREGLLDTFRHVNHQLLLPLDGLHYYSSQKIFCKQCSQKRHKKGEITYSHSMVSATLVHPERREVLPFIPMFIEPQDGHDKQDCEQEACKRWLQGVGPAYARLGVTLLGDDLYCCEPICRLAQQQGFHFILTCKPDSHPCLYEWLDSLEKGNHLHRYQQIIGTLKGKQQWHCRYVNDVPLKEGETALLVNWCEVEVLNAAGQRIYYNTFISDHRLDDKNIIEIIRAGRTRWKIENEHNNTLKNHGYHLMHNYGHGKKYLASLLATLILLSFLLHTLLQLLDERYRNIRRYWPRESFFNQLRTLMMYFYFITWDALMEMMGDDYRPPPRQNK